MAWITLPPLTGWVCPKCQASYSPSVTACWRCWPTHTPTMPPHRPQYSNVVAGPMIYPVYPNAKVE